MPKTIFKYKLDFINSDKIEIEMPKHSELLTVQMQNDWPHLWAIVDTDMPVKTRVFTVIGTGHQLDGWPGVYVGTFQMHGGRRVLHLFDKSGP